MENEYDYEDMGCFFDPCSVCGVVAPLDGLGVCSDCEESDNVVRAAIALGGQ
jgi:hypothetical protein